MNVKEGVGNSELLLLASKLQGVLTDSQRARVRKRSKREASILGSIPDGLKGLGLFKMSSGRLSIGFVALSCWRGSAPHHDRARYDPEKDASHEVLLDAPILRPGLR